MGFKRASRTCRSELSLADITAQRSDAIPGRYTCIECGMVMPLQESWRANNNVVSNFSTLFCAPCAIKLNQSTALNLAPIQLSDFDKLNMGQFVESVGVVSAPQAAPPAESKVSKWKTILG